LPPPSFVRPDGNVVVIVLLFVCELYGLQQVRWVSRAFSREKAIKRFLDIYDEGVKQPGNADKGDLDRGTAAWSRERIGMRLDGDQRGGYRVVMISDGPEFDRCKAEGAC